MSIRNANQVATDDDRGMGGELVGTMTSKVSLH